ncbi:MAG: hypothetical protein PHZ26_02020 [Candidatus Gracilibacteria bacterium]|nr:hypothetical protein [Candidatus Gracilibacteria bacterium]MDD2908511.1 hypothetical protein [Candidatus Gracilibacteria bacterium]
MNKLSVFFGIALLSLTGVFYGFANNVLVTATVGTINHSPIILSVNPSDNPRLLKTNKIQKYIIKLRDDEKDIINYTITAMSGFVSPVNGQISTFDSLSGAYINFTYITPSSVPTGSLDKITLTLTTPYATGETSTGIVTKDLNIYVY